MRTTLIAALLIVLPAAASASESSAAGDSSKGGARPLTRTAAELLEEGLGRSALMRSQLAVLDASDLVVYIAEVFQSEAGEPKGKLQFLSTAGGKRYVIISLDRWKLSRRERLVLLAHEFQHAVEVALEPAVKDLTSFTALYRRIGWEVTAGRFETDGACEATARMRLDLDESRPAPTAATEAPRVGSYDDNGRKSRTNRRHR